MKKALLALMVSLFILLLAACGGGDEAGATEGDDGGSAAVVDIGASNWQFDKEGYTAPAGEITFNLTNEEGVHAIEIEGTDVAIENEGSATATLEAGEYTIKCILPCGEGHEEMTSTLTVE
ncbi:cupredoxin domain-containing protein [Virgibacillus senegalensis]|uniref:cytochrome c oxidase subunit II n=1 Tax=Virgibacillus senegalensis TaxID=1499679 RepID=UPI00069E8C83|nr:cytochrome c oxidase subunit II [Virgibacillus senegalensis]